MQKDDCSNLKNLGSKTTYIYEDPHFSMLETFPNNFKHSGYSVTLKTEEFTSLCPKTGQPDFATITIQYVPNEVCVETKSLKLYLFAYRNQGTFMETITNQIMSDFIEVSNPREIEVTGQFKIRGGVELTVRATWNNIG